MGIFITMKIALRALAKNKLRAGLTVLGVVIGIAAVTTMVSLGQSAAALVQGQLESLGTNVLVVLPGSSQRGGARNQMVTTLTAQDSEAIAKYCPAVHAATPLFSVAGQQVVFRNSNTNPKEIFGVGADYLTVRNWGVKWGVFFTERDIKSHDQVCVIGHTIIAKLFQTTNPLGQTIRINKTSFRVIGVLESKGVNLVGQDQDNIILMPYTTAQKRVQGTSFDHIHAIMVSAKTMDQMNVAEDQIERLLEERHNISPGETADFNVQNTTEISRVLGIITGTITLMLSAIAGISLLVGGVGIMNIMLVSVTERTREIGIRMALGARSRDILRQFLIESVLLSVIGGFVGITLGISASVGLTYLINSISSGSDWPVVISLPAAGIALLFAAMVGIFFGYYPARRASKLDPIEALRYE